MTGKERDSSDLPILLMNFRQYYVNKILTHGLAKFAHGQTNILLYAIPMEPNHLI